MRIKKERFPLIMKDDVEVRDLEELREHFELSRILNYYGDGSLLKWLDLWYFADEADLIRGLNEDDPEYKIKLCEILGIDNEEIVWYRERLDYLKQYTTDKNILKNIDNVAFDSEELYDLLDDENVKEIYLCANEFKFPSGVWRKRNRHYHGIGGTVIIVQSKNLINFDELGITFDDAIKFDDAYEELVKKAFKDMPVEKKFTFYASNKSTEIESKTVDFSIR